MPDLLSIWIRWWKRIAGVTLTAAALAALIVLLLPDQYRAEATALPASTVANNRAHIFNENIESLYPAWGSSDELDRIVGTAHLDTLYLSLAREQGLVAHYGLDTERDALPLAVKRLKNKTDVLKSEYGELKIRVLDLNREKSAALANGLLQKLQALHQYLQNENNRLLAQSIRADYNRTVQRLKAIERGDSSSAPELLSVRKTVLLEQAAQYEKLLAQYGLAAQSGAQVLLTVEWARPPAFAHSPRRVLTIGITMLAAFLFSLLTALFLESRRG